MSDTVEITLSNTIWTDISAGQAYGFFTNHSDRYILYREAVTIPGASVVTGHRLNPGDNKQWAFVNGQSVWARYVPTLTGVPVTVLVTRGYGSFNSGGLSTRDFYLEVTRGNIPGYLGITKYGSNGAVGSAASADVWVKGGDLVYLQAADTLTIVSTDVGDNQAGAGARKITIFGLDNNFDDLVETKDLHPTDGTIAVTTIGEFTRVWRVVVDEVGTYGGGNLGDITIEDTGAVGVQAFIEVGESQTDGTHYTVPAGKTACILRVGIITDSGKALDIDLIGRFGAGIAVAPFKPALHRQHWKGLDAPIGFPYKIYKIFPEKTDIKFRAINNGGAAASVTVDYDMLITDN